MFEDFDTMHLRSRREARTPASDRLTQPVPPPHHLPDWLVSNRGEASKVTGRGEGMNTELGKLLHHFNFSRIQAASCH
jgi:hypothetical protein